MARQRPSKQEEARKAAVKHLSEDAKEGREHAKKDAALARRLKKRGK